MPRLGAVPWRFSGAFPATTFLSRGPLYLKEIAKETEDLLFQER